MSTGCIVRQTRERLPTLPYPEAAKPQMTRSDGTAHPAISPVVVAGSVGEIQQGAPAVRVGVLVKRNGLLLERLDRDERDLAPTNWLRCRC